jgi:hypothetical protein
MSEFDYRYTFDSLQKTPTKVKVVSRPHGISFSTHVSIDDSQFLRRRTGAMSPLLADLIDIGTAVFAADRAAVIKRQEKIQRIHIELPLRCPEHFARPEVYEPLLDALHFFSEDDWSFDFLPRREEGRSAELQMKMEEPSTHVEVSLWSGGLDSLAGLYNRLKEDPHTQHTIFGVGANFTMQGVQHKAALAMQKEYPDRIRLQQVLFQFVKEKRRLRLNPVPRQRGFMFLLFGAVCACLEGQNSLFVYENGVGAINLPFRKSAVSLDHSRAVHPVSLCYMANFLTAVLGTPFYFRNPFLFWTKAQMCEALVQDGMVELIKNTITCDRRLRDEVIQCGKCSSCLLRRQALGFLGLEENNYHIVQARRKGVPVRSEDSIFLRAMHDQVAVLRGCLTAADPWVSIANEYHMLPIVVHWLTYKEGTPSQELQNHLVQLYRKYVDEWRADVCAALNNDLLEDDEIHRLPSQAELIMRRGHDEQ